MAWKWTVEWSECGAALMGRRRDAMLTMKLMMMVLVTQRMGLVEGCRTGRACRGATTSEVAVPDQADVADGGPRMRAERRDMVVTAISQDKRNKLHESL